MISDVEDVFDHLERLLEWAHEDPDYHRRALANVLPWGSTTATWLQLVEREEDLEGDED